MKIRELEFVFENCEVLSLDAKDIILVSTTDTQPPHVFVAVHKNAEPNMNSVLFEQGGLKLRTDVTSVFLKMDDGTTETIVLPWQDDYYVLYSDYQRVSTTPEGHFIFINSTELYLDSMSEHVDKMAANM